MAAGVMAVLVTLPAANGADYGVEQLATTIGVVQTLTGSSVKQAKADNFSVIREVVIWYGSTQGSISPSLDHLKEPLEAASKSGMEVCFTVYPDPHLMPLHRPERRQFVRFVVRLARIFPLVGCFEIGNEPNSNFFWPRQFNRRGRSLAPAEYASLLAHTYDALKRAGNLQQRAITVIGCALTSHGSDDPHSLRPSHSPVSFLIGMGKAMRRSGRMAPIMDICSVHPYGVTNTDPPWTVHSGGTIGLADDTKLRRTISRAFAGTGQPEDTPPLWSEYGVDSCIPPDKAYMYVDDENQACVSEKRSAVFYRSASQLAAGSCIGLWRFHLIDEPSMKGWQSGLYYADGKTLKSSARRDTRSAGYAQQNIRECG
jgi:hypothetical protein